MYRDLWVNVPGAPSALSCTRAKRVTNVANLANLADEIILTERWRAVGYGTGKQLFGQGRFSLLLRSGSVQVVLEQSYLYAYIAMAHRVTADEYLGEADPTPASFPRKLPKTMIGWRSGAEGFGLLGWLLCRYALLETQAGNTHGPIRGVRL